MKPFPQPLELVSFFEAEPSCADSGVPWHYNQLDFDTRHGSDRVRCTIAPGYGIFRLSWCRDEGELAALDLTGVSSMVVEREGEGEVLVVRSDEAAQVWVQLRLRLRPNVHVFIQTELST